MSQYIDDFTCTWNKVTVVTVQSQCSFHRHLHHALLAIFLTRFLSFSQFTKGCLAYYTGSSLKSLRSCMSKKSTSAQKGHVASWSRSQLVTAGGWGYNSFKDRVPVEEIENNFRMNLWFKDNVPEQHSWYWPPGWHVLLEPGLDKFLRLVPVFYFRCLHSCLD